MNKRAIAIALSCWVMGGCYDFVDPDFPEAGAPAVLQVAAYGDEAGPIGINGLLVPGLGIGGVQRNVARDTLDFYGLSIAPTAIRNNGSREYNRVDTVKTNVFRPFTLTAPRVEDVTSLPPQIRWFPIRRADPDTIVWKRGTALVLHVDTALGVSQPVPPIRQWFVSVNGTTVSFRISSDGLPPTTLAIPPEWIPQTNNGTITVLMSFYQAGIFQSVAHDYIENVSFNFQLRWYVRVTQ